MEKTDLFAEGKIEFAILTSISDSDALIIDERLADGSKLYDETVTATRLFDEGSLA